MVYSRTWEPRWGVINLEWIREFLTAYYFYKPQITGEQITKDLGLLPIAKMGAAGSVDRDICGLAHAERARSLATSSSEG